MSITNKNKLESFIQTLFMGSAIINLPTKANHKIACQRQAAKDVVESYFSALNNSDINTLMNLFHEKSVYMEDNGHSIEGQQRIRNQLNTLFKKVQHQAKLIQSQISINGNIAIIECDAAIRLKMHETGIELPVVDHDLFVLIKLNNQWKIDRFVNNGNSSYLDDSSA